ncbi:MAG: ferritin-like domain-containing protein, partial [Rhizobiales bacterium]|nr:ferritin-like domain-containing protein [Rhizobacter sp.]
EDIIKLLNDSLATELVCVMRYKRHHFTAKGLASPKIAEEFLVHAQEESAHADMIAERIVQLGGEPDFSPSTLIGRSHADYDESTELKAMIRANLVAERVAIEAYSQMIHLIGDKDSTTRRILETILSQEQEHADELSDWMTD